MSRLGWLRQPMSIVLLLSFSCAAWGADDSGPAAAMLFVSGNVRINGVGGREPWPCSPVIPCRLMKMQWSTSRTAGRPCWRCRVDP